METVLKCVTIATFLLLRYIPVAAECPQYCTCRSGEVKCRRASLTSVPSNLNSNTVVIDLSFNSISILANSVFDNMPLLKTIVVSDSGIINVEPEVFDELQNLREIDLHNNNIDYIHPSLFQNNPNLSMLDLSHNDLKQLRLDFSYNTELKFLNLSVNMLKFEDLTIFHPLISLQILDLSNNQMENMSGEVFDGMVDLKYLDVSGNPQLEYDCRLRTLCYNRSITCITDDEQSFKMVDNLHCDTEEQLITMSLTDETDGFITTSESSTEGSVDEGSGMESTEIIVDNEVKEFNSTEKAFIQPTITANDDWILITIIVGSVFCFVVVITVAVICIRRYKNSREETSGNLSRTNSINYLNQEDQFSRKYKNTRNDNIKNHNNYDRVSPEFNNSVLQFKVGSTVAAEVVRVPSFKTRGVAAPLNLPEEIPLQETKFIIENKRDVSHLTIQPSADLLSRSTQVLPCEEGETVRVQSVKYTKYPEGSASDNQYAKPEKRKALAARLS